MAKFISTVWKSSSTYMIELFELMFDENDSWNWSFFSYFYVQKAKSRHKHDFFIQIDSRVAFLSHVL